MIRPIASPITIIRPIIKSLSSQRAGTTEVLLSGESEGRSGSARVARYRHCLLPKFGQSIVEVHQEIAAALLSPVLARGLKVKAGTTALEVQRTSKLANGRIAQVAINTHPASRFRHFHDDASAEGG